MENGKQHQRGVQKQKRNAKGRSVGIGVGIGFGSFTRRFVPVG